MEENSLKYQPVGWTTYREAKELVKLGLDPRTADMCYMDVDEANTSQIEPIPICSNRNKNSVPCWSLGKLLNLLPDCTNDGYYLEIDRYMVKYVKRQFGFDAKVACFNKENFIESVIEALKHFCKKGKYNVE